MNKHAFGTNSARKGTEIAEGSGPVAATNANHCEPRAYHGVNRHRSPLQDKSFSPLPVQNEDLQLVHRAQQGDTAAFGELVTKFRNRVFIRIYRVIQNEEDALDVSQKTFVKVWQRISEFDGKSSFYTWIYSVATHMAIEWLRRSRHCFVELDVNLRSPVAHPDHEIQRNEVRQFVLDAVAKLTPRQRAVIVLKDLEDFHYSEIAEMLQCSIGTVMSRLFYGRRKLQTLLKPLYECLL
jgi:RNA polymerase sigma-70 factor, ECF subfamily